MTSFQQVSKALSAISINKVRRPEIVQHYHAAMRGVDKLDMLISLYRIYIKSRKWTLRMITHALDIAVANSWLEYRRDAERLDVAKKDILDLLHFRLQVTDCLIRKYKPVQIAGKKRGRPIRTSTETDEIPHVESTTKVSKTR